MLLGTIQHRVLELVFPAETPIPADDACRAAAPNALSMAISEEAPWLDDPAWAAERASLAHEAVDVAVAWGRFLRNAGAENRGSKVPRFVRAAFVDDTHHCVILCHQWPARHTLAKLPGHFNEVNRVFDGQAADRSGPHIQPVARSGRREPSRDSIGFHGG
ncbi:hypothetical protein [Sinisalibacter aestuarii]|nr:hypothetical protein [Sinisalibacter aestuarii]